MMKKILIIFLLALLPALSGYSRPEMVKFEKAVVDTAECMRFFRNSVELYNKKTLEQIERLKKEKGDKKKIKELEEDLFHVPDHFSEAEWRKIFFDNEMPSKEIIIEREAEGIDRYQFMALVDTLYPTDSAKEIFAKNFSAIGQFDGHIRDCVGIFPYNTTLKPASEFDETQPEGDVAVFDKFLVKSMWETTPPLVLPVGFEAKTGAIYVTLCKARWDKSGEKRDGLDIMVMRPGSSEGMRVFLYYDGEKWVEASPQNAEWLSYDECYKKIDSTDSTPIVLKGKGRTSVEDGKGVPFSFSFLVATDGLLYGEATDYEPILKYKLQINGEKREGNCFLDEPNFKKIYVEKNYEGLGTDVIVMEFISYMYDYRDRIKRVYKPTIDASGLMKAPIVEGRSIDQLLYLEKIAEGVYDEKGKKWVMDLR